MQVHTDLETFRGVERPVLTTGTFDGVHLGHRVILDRLNQVARREEGSSVLFTFHPHPRMVLFPNDNDLKLLNTQQEKVALLEAAGVDHLLVIPFSRAFSRLKALEYVRDVLVEGIGVHALVIGHDHRFGRNREGDIHLLRQLGDVYDFMVEEIPAREVDHVQVSSTKVRLALEVGDVRTAKAYLGYAYELSGVVVKGDQRGRTIGFPTANIGLAESTKLVPASGVYAITAQLHNETLKGMLNIGVRPTVEAHGERTVEANLFGLDREIYGETLRVRFVERLRDEIRFSGLDALKAQLNIDREQARAALASNAAS